MPLFAHKDKTPATVPVPVHHAPPPRASRESGRKGIFGTRHRSSSNSSSDLDRHNNLANGNNHLSKRTSTGAGGIFHRNTHVEDPSIAAARTRVHAAEQAEKDADRALIQARQAVRDARQHVRALELEAKEEARLAKIKGDQAHAIGKSARGLGRHG